MLLTKRTRLIILAGLLALAGVALAAVLILRAQRPPDLFQRASQAGFNLNDLPPYPPDASGLYGRLSQAADLEPTFRHWLLSIVENPKEDWGLRHEALASLVNMGNDAALARVMRDLLDWMDEKREPTGGDQNIAEMARTYIWVEALQMNLPDPQVLGILKRDYPDKWHEMLVGDSRITPEEVARRGKPWDQIVARAKALVQYLERTEGSGSAPGRSNGPASDGTQ
jgi:hypothetical protein